MHNRRAARRAGSKIAGDLGSGAKIIQKKDFRLGPPSWRDSKGRIGVQKRDQSAGWRDDSPGNPQFGAGPHVNAWNIKNGISSNLHLDY